MSCTITAPGHAANLTGVKAGLALLRDPWRAPVPATVTTVHGDRIALALPAGTIEARCHDAERLATLLDAAAAAGGPAPRALFTAHERQLFVEIEQGAVLTLGGTVYVAPASSTGVFVAFNLALPWHDDVPCGEPRVAGGADGAEGADGDPGEVAA